MVAPQPHDSAVCPLIKQLEPCHNIIKQSAGLARMLSENESFARCVISIFPRRNSVCQVCVYPSAGCITFHIYTSVKERRFTYTARNHGQSRVPSIITWKQQQMQDQYSCQPYKAVGRPDNNEARRMFPRDVQSSGIIVHLSYDHHHWEEVAVDLGPC